MTGSHRVRCVYWNAQIYYTESRAFVPNLFAVLWTSKMGRHLLVLHLSALWVCTVAKRGKQSSQDPEGLLPQLIDKAVTFR